MNFNYLHLISFLLILLFIPACGEDDSQPANKTTVRSVQAKKSKKKAVTVKKADAEKKESAKSVYFYDPSGKKDPFYPILIEKKVEIEAELKEAEREEPKTYLETLELSQLKLVAVMILADRSVAMVEDPDGKGHTIYIGTPIGKSGGKVVGIKDSKIIIEEKYKKKGDIVPVFKEIVIQSSEDKKR